MNKFVLAALALVSLVFVGCGSGENRTSTHTVRGKLTDGSKPVAHAQVVFHPVGGSAETHERMQETAARFSENLEKRGKRLQDASAKEAMDLLRDAIEKTGQ